MLTKKRPSSRLQVEPVNQSGHSFIHSFILGFKIF